MLHAGCDATSGSTGSSRPHSSVAPSVQPSGDSEDSYELEVESDEGLEGAEIIDEEEDYAYVMVGWAPVSPGGAWEEDHVMMAGFKRDIWQLTMPK